MLAQQSLLSERAVEIEHLKLIIAKLKRLQFGRRSEKLDREIEQLELQARGAAGLEPAGSCGSGRREGRRRKHRCAGRCRSICRATRVEHAPACACPDCGAAMRKIGEDVAEMLDYVPARFKVIQHVRPKLACPACERIVQVAAPSRPIERGLAGAGLLAHVLVAKYADHLPLYRQAQIYAREGVELDRSTLADWVGGCFRLLDPLVDALGALRDGGAVSCMPTTRRCRCSIRDAARPRPAGCGPMCAMIARRQRRAAGGAVPLLADRKGERPRDT